MAELDSPIKKLTKEEKIAKKAKKAEKAAKKAAKEQKVEKPVEDAEVEDAEVEAEEVAEDDGFKVHKYEAPPEPEDETLQCRDCGGDFIFTVGEQEFFKSKGFDNKKTRCAECTAAKKARFGEESGKGGGKGKGKGKGGGKGDKGKGGGGGGVCYAFQKGECTRGDSCRFSH